MSVTDPFPAEVADLVTRPHRQWCQLFYSTDYATATPPTLVELDLVDGTVSWDEKRSPRVIADVMVAVDEENRAAVLADLDPRAYVMGTFVVTHVLDDGSEDGYGVATLQLRTRGIGENGLIRLVFASKEAQVIDVASEPIISGLVGSASTTFTADPAAYVTAGLENILAPGGPGDPATVVNTVPASSQSLPAQQSGTSWDYWQSLADAAGFDIYDEGDTVLRVAPRVFDTDPDNVTTLTVYGDAATILTSEAVTTREEFANWLRVQFEWFDDTGTGLTQHTQGADAKLTTGPFSTTASGERWSVQRYEGRPSAAYMRALVLENTRLLLARCKSATVTAVPAWWLRPGDTVYLEPVGEAGAYALVSSVEFLLTGQEMRVELRYPSTDVDPADYTLSDWGTT